MAEYTLKFTGDAPTGWKPVAYRVPAPGDWVLGYDGKAYETTTAFIPIPVIPMVILERERWRAERHDYYWFCNSFGEPERSVEDSDSLDLNRWTAGNYFRTQLEVLVLAVMIKQVLKEHGSA